MTQAEIGAVAALRECSVVFAALIGVLALGEPFRRARAGGDAADPGGRGGAEIRSRAEPRVGQPKQPRRRGAGEAGRLAPLAISA